MYFNILKKDLKRKKTMNIILLIFIILATMFVSSSVNNIISVTTALDNYLDMANAPDYLMVTMNKAFEKDVENFVNSAKTIENYSIEKMMFLSPDNFIFEDENIKVLNGTNMIQSDEELALNYFLSDGSILNKVESGKLYMTEGAADTIGIEVGDKIIIDIEGIKTEFTFAGGIKDAVLGSNQSGVQRYIINKDDFNRYLEKDKDYGGKLIYIHTNEFENMLSEIKPISENSILNMDRAYMEFIYIFDMIVTGLILVVSSILIAIAFVVLRFTITFTLTEEFREIGVMKAIGITNFKIRGLYIVKYTALSILGAIIGVILSLPFGNLLMSVSSKSIIISNQSPVFINVSCAVIVVGVILLFCFCCTNKVKKMKPIDAIRNGETGERFRKRSYMKLGKSKLPAMPFLALNDILSNPKRFGIITIIFFLCISLSFILSLTISTFESGTMYNLFGLVECDLYIEDDITDFMFEDGQQKLQKSLKDLEKELEKNGMPAKCMKEMVFTLPVSFGENRANIISFHGIGTTMDMYEYLEGTPPQNNGEIAITKISANKIKATIGDTITIHTVDGDKQYIITAFFQSMLNIGDGIRFYSNENLNYIQSQGGIGTQVKFSDNPTEEEIEDRIEKIKLIFSKFDDVKSSKKTISEMLSVTDTLKAIKILVVILTIILVALITVLMERSFISKEQTEIALMKAIGIKNGKIYLYHSFRFLFIGIVAVILSEIFAMPLTHLCIDPVFKMMGAESGANYIKNPSELYIIYPGILFITTMISAFITALYTRKIKSSDISNNE